MTLRNGFIAVSVKIHIFENKFLAWWYSAVSFTCSLMLKLVDTP